MEKAAEYGAWAVFFEAASDGSHGAPQAFVYVDQGPADSPEFAKLHQRLWSWGGVPIAYRHVPGLVQMFRCAHGPDFQQSGRLVCRPYDVLGVGIRIASQKAWWDAERLLNGSLWRDEKAASELLSPSEAAHPKLIAAVRNLKEKVAVSDLLDEVLMKRLLIQSLLIAYLDQRGALPEQFFGRFVPGATTFPQVLANGTALEAMLVDLEGRFNGDVFDLNEEERREISTSGALGEYASLIEAKEEAGGQLTLWELYSFRDLPVEVISHVYELFVSEPATSVYTPPALVRLVLDEVLDDERLDRLTREAEVVLDPSCGSGVFLSEAYRRIVLHWRRQHGWAVPDVGVARALLFSVHGVDVDDGALDLANFSLCLALCDALTAEQIRSTTQLFPKLRDVTLLHGCFFEKYRLRALPRRVGAIVGNPPFESILRTQGARQSAERFSRRIGPLPDNQVAYLFLHDAMRRLRPGGVLAMLQPYGLFYNLGPATFRRTLFQRWDMREVLDFVSIRGMFSKDTKVVVPVIEATRPAPERRVLHAVFRRTPLTEADRRFEVDYYDRHWIPREILLRDASPHPWRANLLGGGRTYGFVRRLREMPTLVSHAKAKGWTFGEGFIEGAQGRSRNAEHLYGRPLLPSEALKAEGIDRTRIGTVPRRPIEGPRTSALFTPPMLLVREQKDLPHALWTDGYLTYKNKIVGFAAHDAAELHQVEKWLRGEQLGLRAYLAAISVRMLTQKATTLSCDDIYALPYDPEATSLGMSENERLVAKDVADRYVEFVRHGSASALGKAVDETALEHFGKVLCKQINAFYASRPLRRLEEQRWPGFTCQVYGFGEGGVDWSGCDELRDRLDLLLRERRNASLSVTRIARIYDGRFVILLKPDRLRHWLPSVALRDGDDMLAELRAQRF